MSRNEQIHREYASGPPPELLDELAGRGGALSMPYLVWAAAIGAAGCGRCE
jgi:hypothetical protein